MNHRLALIASAMQAFAEAGAEPEALLDTVVRQTAELFHCFCSINTLVDGGANFRREAAYASDPAMLEIVLTAFPGPSFAVTADSSVFMTIRSGRSLLVRNFDPAPYLAVLPPERAAAMRRMDIRSLLHCPMRVGGRVIGLVTLFRHGKETRPFEAEDVSFAELLAGHAAQLLSTSRLLASERAAREVAERSLAERDRVERALRRWEVLLELAPDAIVITDSVGTIQLVNAQTERLFGYDRKELVGRLADLLLAERHRPARFDALPTGMLAGRCKDGREVPIEVSSRPLETEDGALVSSTIRDATERRDTETRAREADRLKSELIADLSHELRTPLTAIIGFSELLLNTPVGPLNERQREFLDDISTSSHHLLYRINGLLDLAKIESGTMIFSPMPVQLEVIVAEVANVGRGLAAGKQLRLETEVDPAIGELFLDGVRLRQILYSYVSNAVKFTADGGQVSVRARPEGDGRFRIEVEDTGVGIAEPDLPRLFVELQQLGVQRERDTGLGVGLALTRWLAEAQGGQVEVRSTVGTGSTFSVVLPRRAQG